MGLLETNVFCFRPKILRVSSLKSEKTSLVEYIHDNSLSKLLLSLSLTHIHRHRERERERREWIAFLSRSCHYIVCLNTHTHTHTYLQKSSVLLKTAVTHTKNTIENGKVWTILLRGRPALEVRCFWPNNYEFTSWTASLQYGAKRTSYYSLRGWADLNRRSELELDSALLGWQCLLNEQMSAWHSTETHSVVASATSI